MVSELLQQLAVQPQSHSLFQLQEGLLRYKNCIWVGADTELQVKFIKAFHATTGGHSGFPVTYKRLLSLFRWAGMKAQVQHFVATCQICQQAKPERVLYPGKLTPLRVPPSAWHTISLDFIHGLPPSGKYNCILVIIDSFSKYGNFLPLKHPFSAAKIAEVFIDTIYKLHGLPAAVVSDRDPIFTSSFWQNIFSRLGTELCMSSSYHPQSDGQTERFNQTVECYLRCFISAHPKEWSRWLSLCEFWYNTNWHSATGKSPFEIVYGHPPRYFGVSPYSAIASDSIDQWLQNRSFVMASVKQHLDRAKLRMKTQADKKRIDRQFEVGDMVFSKLQPYVQASVADRTNRKLSFKNYGPFRVLA